jgi:hypothetical protein
LPRVSERKGRGRAYMRRGGGWGIKAVVEGRIVHVVWMQMQNSKQRNEP